MGVFGGPEIPNDGLVLALDGANYKSFKGESVINLYYANAESSANNSIFHMPMGGTATGSYTTSHSYGSWSGNTIFKVTVSAGTLSGGYESFRACVPASFTSTYGTTRRLSAKVKMLKGSITSLGFHNGGGTGGHDSGHYTPINEFSVPTDVLSKDGWYQFDIDVSGTYTSGHCVGIGIVGSDIEFLVTEMMLYPSLTFIRFTPTTRGTTVATGGGWADLTGNGNNGELVNGVRESSANGGSLSFDGSNDYISVTPINRLTTTTLDIWFNTSSVSNDIGIRQYLYTQQRNPPTLASFTYRERQGIQIAGNILGFQYLDTTNNDGSIVSISTISANTWYNFVVTLDGTTPKMYLNGTQLSVTGNLSTPKSLTVNQAFVGRRGDANGEDLFGGKIASVRDYNRALSAAEISQNFNATRSRYGI